jgi:hypothetical protein
MDNQNKQVELTPDQLIKLKEGMALKEMTLGAGWKIFKRWLEDRAYHSWIDPKETNAKDEWVWQELNAFHSADVSKNLLLDIEEAIQTADQLEDVRLGKVQPSRMRI